MKRTYEEQKEHDERNVRFSALNGIKDTVTCQKYVYPEKFYLILEYLDLVARLRSGEELEASGVHELAQLLTILCIDYSLLASIPKEAYTFLKCLVQPQKDFEIFDATGMGHGALFRAYYAFRQYLIDNKERVMESWNAIYEFSTDLTKKQNEKYAKRLKEIDNV